jgi:ectoine hydroxylase-related dioxygenase (phytanoyl-CoA dioxygenase family)
MQVSPEVTELANSSAVKELIEAVLGPCAFPVRSILFDKVPDANWKVPWHQDVTIAVQQRMEAEGFGPWTMKADIIQVQPPAAILENMVSVRLHLDDCGEEKGALRVIPGSHLKGRIPKEEIVATGANPSEHVCAVGRGDALLMRPLLLHASSPSRLPGHRRVIHLDFAAVQLPSGMNWHSETPSRTLIPQMR